MKGLLDEFEGAERKVIDSPKIISKEIKNFCLKIKNFGSDLKKIKVNR